jgi:hypothetical protein
MSVYTVSSETDIGTGAAANDALWIYDTSAGAMRKVTAGRVSGAPVNCTASTRARWLR